MFTGARNYEHLMHSTFNQFINVCTNVYERKISISFSFNFKLTGINPDITSTVVIYLCNYVRLENKSYEFEEIKKKKLNVIIVYKNFLH